MARIVVLGAGGFLGGHVARALEAEHEVVKVGRTVRGSGTWHTIDLASDPGGDLERLVEDAKPDAIVNCIGALGGTHDVLIRANTLTVAHLLDVLSARGGHERLVHLGSAAEYGPPAERVPLTETFSPRPLSAYGISKLAASQLVLGARRARHVDAVVLRIFNPVGPGIPVSTLPGRAADSIRRAMVGHQSEILLGPLNAYRDYIDVRDVASAAMACALAARTPPELLNIGSGTATLARALIGMLSEESGFKGNVVEADAPSTRSSTTDWIAADTTLARRELGWQPRFGLRDSLRAQWQATMA